MLMLDSDLEAGLPASSGSSTLGFCKMQGLGNDFVVVWEDDLNSALTFFRSKKVYDAPLFEPDDILSRLAKSICARNLSVGADGLIVARRGSRPDRMSWSYLNSDGSVSQMCGNGLRCLALWFELSSLSPARNYIVETGKGLVEIKFESQDLISTDLGEPILEPDLIPARFPAARIPGGKSEPRIIARGFTSKNSKNYKLSCLSMGNPHCVIFVDYANLESSELAELASELQTSEHFPESVNVEFVRVDSNDHLRAVVYERGCGRTMACASGAAACLVAAVLEGRCSRELEVMLDGGPLQLSWSETDNHVRITGPARLVFRGAIDLASLNLEGQEV